MRLGLLITSGFTVLLGNSSFPAQNPPLDPADFKEPAPRFEHILDATPDRSAIDSLYYDGLYDFVDEDYPAAIEKLEVVIMERPSAIPAWEALGWSYWHMDRREDAIRLWRDLIVLNPNLPKAHNMLGMASTGIDDIDTALKHYLRSLELDPNQFSTSLSVARIYRWRGRQEDAIVILERLLAEDPDRTDVRLELARAMLQNWRYKEARPHWEIILAAAPDYVPHKVAMATVLLHLDERDEAIVLIDEVLQGDQEHRDALNLLAAAQEYGDQPQTAIPTLRRLLQLENDPDQLHTLRTRLVRLHVRLYRDDPQTYALDAAIQLTHDMVGANPKNTDTRLLLGELHAMDRQFEEAEKHLSYVLKNMNPNNLRAHRGLFEVFMAQREHEKAWEYFENVRAFNPDDPYLHYLLARYESGRGRFHQAYQALDELELAGRRGSVAVLLYHAISPSDWNAPPSVRRLHDQVKALQDAGYRFITPDELPAYFASLPEPESGQRGPIDRVAMITFDDALRSSMEYGTQVAEKLNVRFTQFVITGFTDREDPFICTWEELQAYQKTGRWSFQSQLYLAEQPGTIDGDGASGMPLANRLWLPDQNRLETPEEYVARIRYDYAHSRELLETYLPAPGTAKAVAYPLGELGQNTGSNNPDAIAHNLDTGSETFETGFLQSSFGHAVKGNHPFLQQRHELRRHAEGPDALAQVMENHPVLLAERMRAEFAAMQGKTRQALRSLRQLEDYGYPDESLQRVRTYVNERVARRFAAPTAAERARKGFFDIQLSDPYIGAEARYFRDNLGRRNWFTDFLGGLNVTPRLTLEGRAGYGQLKQDAEQPFADGAAQPNIKFNVDEIHLGLRGAYVVTDNTMLSAELGQREFSGDADQSITVFAVEGFFRPLLLLDTYVRYERDAIESAQSVVDGLTHDMIAGHGIFHVMDWWDIWVSAMHYDFSDDNDRTHVTLASEWKFWERWGAYAGLRYGYVTSDVDARDYWTPYRMNRYYVEAGLRKNLMRVYYRLALRGGIGRQSVRPEAQAAFEELRARAAVQQFDPGAPPSADWVTVVGATASTRIRFRDHWEVNGEISYNRLPDYNELNMNAGVKYRF